MDDRIGGWWPGVAGSRPGVRPPGCYSRRFNRPCVRIILDDGGDRSGCSKAALRHLRSEGCPRGSSSPRIHTSLCWLLMIWGAYALMRPKTADASTCWHQQLWSRMYGRGRPDQARTVPVRARYDAPALCGAVQAPHRSVRYYPGCGRGWVPREFWQSRSVIAASDADAPPGPLKGEHDGASP